MTTQQKQYNPALEQFRCLMAERKGQPFNKERSQQAAKIAREEIQAWRDSIHSLKTDKPRPAPPRRVLSPKAQHAKDYINTVPDRPSARDVAQKFGLTITYASSLIMKRFGRVDRDSKNARRYAPVIDHLKTLTERPTVRGLAKQFGIAKPAARQLICAQFGEDQGEIRQAALQHQSDIHKAAYLERENSARAYLATLTERPTVNAIVDRFGVGTGKVCRLINERFGEYKRSDVRRALAKLDSRPAVDWVVATFGVNQMHAERCLREVFGSARLDAQKMGMAYVANNPKVAAQELATRFNRSIYWAREIICKTRGPGHPYNEAAQARRAAKIAAIRAHLAALTERPTRISIVRQFHVNGDDAKFLLAERFGNKRKAVAK